jgi:polyferredoxin
MFRIGKPKGLIRFASFHSIRSGIEKVWTRRATAYSIALFFLLAILGLALATRTDVETTMLKVSGTLYQREPGLVTNLYNAEFINKTFEPVVLEVRLESPASATIQKVDGKALVVPPEGMIKAVYFIKIPDREVTNARTVVRLGIYENGKKIETLKVKFIGPVSKASDARR